MDLDQILNITLVFQKAIPIQRKIIQQEDYKKIKYIMFYCYSNSPTGDQVFCLYNIYSSNNMVLSQFHNHVQALKVNNSSGPLDNQTWHANGWPQQNLPKFSYSHNSTLANRAVFHSVCQVWSSSGLPEYFTFSCCTRLWKWLFNANMLLAYQFGSVSMLITVCN